MIAPIPLPDSSFDHAKPSYHAALRALFSHTTQHSRISRIVHNWLASGPSREAWLYCKGRTIRNDPQSYIEVLGMSLDLFPYRVKRQGAAYRMLVKNVCLHFLWR
jgi:hypothetical protein